MLDYVLTELSSSFCARVHCGCKGSPSLLPPREDYETGGQRGINVQHTQHLRSPDRFAIGESLSFTLVFTRFERKAAANQNGVIYGACASPRVPWREIGGCCIGTKDVLSLSVSLPGELDQLRLFTHVT